MIYIDKTTHQVNPKELRIGKADFGLDKERMFYFEPPVTHQSETPPKKKAHACRFCSKTFSCSGHLQRHELIHSGLKPYACPIPGCMSKFSRHDNMMQHYRTHLRKIQKTDGGEVSQDPSLSQSSSASSLTLAVSQPTNEVLAQPPVTVPPQPAVEPSNPPRQEQPIQELPATFQGHFYLSSMAQQRTPQTPQIPLDNAIHNETGSLQGYPDLSAYKLNPQLAYQMTHPSHMISQVPPPSILPSLHAQMHQAYPNVYPDQPPSVAPQIMYTVQPHIYPHLAVSAPQPMLMHPPSFPGMPGYPQKIEAGFVYPSSQIYPSN